jgi:hypothetical protein
MSGNSEDGFPLFSYPGRTISPMNGFKTIVPAIALLLGSLPVTANADP